MLRLVRVLGEMRYSGRFRPRRGRASHLDEAGYL